MKNKSASTRPWWQEWQFWLMIAVLIIGVAVIVANQASQSRTASPNTTPPGKATIDVKKTPTKVNLSNCTVESNASPTQDTTQTSAQSLFKPVNASDWILGAKEAPITILIYSDFQCVPCAQLAQVLEALQKEFPNDVRVVFRNFTLSNHDKAVLADQAAEAAGLQGKFWEMHDSLMTKQSSWSGLSPADFETWLDQQASDLTLNADQFNADLKSSETVKKVADAEKDGLAINLPGVPILLIGGSLWQGPHDLDNLRTGIRLLMLEQRQFTGCPSTVIDMNKQYLATLQTNKGDILIQLYPDKAPISVNSFVFLARHGWYDGVIFHTVIPGYIAQTGDPSGTGFGGPGYMIADEMDPTMKFDQPGRVGMVNSKTPGSNNSQFFITYTAQPALNGKYTIFGQVIKGMDVINSLVSRNSSQSTPQSTADQITKVTIEEK